MSVQAPKRPGIVIDGLDVANSYSKNEFNAASILQATDFFRLNGHSCVVILPNAVKTTIERQTRVFAENQAVLNSLFNDDILFFAPDRMNPNDMIIAHAMETNSFIVSCNNYETECSRHSKWAPYVQKYRLTYIFEDDEFVVTTNSNVCLNEFLERHPNSETMTEILSKSDDDILEEILRGANSQRATVTNDRTPVDASISPAFGGNAQSETNPSAKFPQAIRVSSGHLGVSGQKNVDGRRSVNDFIAEPLYALGKGPVKPVSKSPHAALDKASDNEHMSGRTKAKIAGAQRTVVSGSDFASTSTYATSAGTSRRGFPATSAFNDHAHPLVIPSSNIGTDLRKCENAWKPKHKANGGEYADEADSENQKLLRDFRGALNKVKRQNINVLSDSLLELGKRMVNEKGVIGLSDIFFQKAVEDQSFCDLYCSVCRLLQQHASDEASSRSSVFAPGTDMDFCHVVIQKCKNSVKRIGEPTGVLGMMEAASAAASVKEKNSLRSELQELQATQKRQNLGIVRFMGCLYNNDLITSKDMHHHIFLLFNNAQNEEPLECLCELLTTAGKHIDSEENSTYLSITEFYYQELEQLATSKKISRRVRFKMLNLLDLRKNHWRRKKTAETEPERRIDPMQENLVYGMATTTDDDRCQSSNGNFMINFLPTNFAGTLSKSRSIPPNTEVAYLAAQFDSRHGMYYLYQALKIWAAEDIVHGSGLVDSLRTDHGFISPGTYAAMHYLEKSKVFCSDAILSGLSKFAPIAASVSVGAWVHFKAVNLIQNGVNFWVAVDVSYAYSKGVVVRKGDTDGYAFVWCPMGKVFAALAHLSETQPYNNRKFSRPTLRAGDWVDFRLERQEEQGGMHWKALEIKKCDPPAGFSSRDQADHRTFCLSGIGSTWFAGENMKTRFVWSPYMGKMSVDRTFSWKENGCTSNAPLQLRKVRFTAAMNCAQFSASQWAVKHIQPLAEEVKPD